jgi:hypothetical protein
VVVPDPCPNNGGCQLVPATDLGPVTVPVGNPCDELAEERLCEVPVTDASPIVAPLFNPCDQLGSMACTVPTSDESPIAVPLDNPCDELGSMACTVPTSDESPVPLPLVNPCDVAQSGTDCQVPAEDPSPITIAPQNPCTEALAVCDLPPVDLPPTTVDIINPCDEALTCEVPVVDLHPIIIPQPRVPGVPGSGGGGGGGGGAEPSPSPATERVCSEDGGPLSTDLEAPQDEAPFCLEEDPDDPAVVVPFSEPNEVLVLTANVFQAIGSNEACPADDAATPGDGEEENEAYRKAKKCNADGIKGREGAFAKRVRDLAKKELMQDIDGMGAIPDVILLQEIRRDNPSGDDVKHIVKFLNGAIKTTLDKDPKDDRPDHADFRVAKSRRGDWTFNKSFAPGAKEGDPPVELTKADTAILFNFDTMRRLRADFDGDGGCRAVAGRRTGAGLGPTGRIRAAGQELSLGHHRA